MLLPIVNELFLDRGLHLFRFNWHHLDFGLRGRFLVVVQVQVVNIQKLSNVLVIIKQVAVSDPVIFLLLVARVTKNSLSNHSLILIYNSEALYTRF